MLEPERRSLPAAAGHDALLPFYDPFAKFIGIDRTRRALLEQAELRPGHRVLDVGCGTGSLVVLIKRRHPEVEVVGLDPDPQASKASRMLCHTASRLSTASSRRSCFTTWNPPARLAAGRLTSTLGVNMGTSSYKNRIRRARNSTCFPASNSSHRTRPYRYIRSPYSIH
jgi:SAM-dependent methyltransferase